MISTASTAADRYWYCQFLVNLSLAVLVLVLLVHTTLTRGMKTVCALRFSSKSPEAFATERYLVSVDVLYCAI